MLCFIYEFNYLKSGNLYFFFYFDNMINKFFLFFLNETVRLFQKIDPINNKAQIHAKNK